MEDYRLQQNSVSMSPCVDADLGYHQHNFAPRLFVLGLTSSDPAYTPFGTIFLGTNYSVAPLAMTANANGASAASPLIPPTLTGTNIFPQANRKHLRLFAILSA